MILPHKLATTNDQLTSRAGLLTIAQLMESMQLAERVDKHFPNPKSNRGFMPSVYIQTLVLMQHQGYFHLDEVRHLNDDTALTEMLGLTTIPSASTLGAWLRKMGDSNEAIQAWETVNKAVLQATLHRRKRVTLDIDATEVVAHKADAKWTYNKNKGYMPMVGHIAETGQVVSCDFRQGNASPSKQNFEFIQQCQRALPHGCTVGALRIDAAGYQTRIIQYCDEQQIDYAIRAKMSSSVRRHLSQLSEVDWKPLIKRNGQASEHQSTHRMPHCIGDYEHAFDLVVQRQPIRQSVLDLDENTDSQAHCAEGFIYRAIATNRSALSDSEIIHWYNQRAEDSENRIKELKLDFGGDTLPCSDFNANALYFHIAALSYNLFALMRQLLPEDLANHRATTIRWRLYGMAAKWVRTGRKVWLKLQQANKNLLERVLEALRRFDPPPI
jgi:hypothetical protein